MDFKERRFVTDMVDRLNKCCSISAKQANWLRSLHYRLGGEYVR
jgi:hypothetical protein